MVGLFVRDEQNDIDTLYTLINDKYKPTPLLIAAGALELVIDITISYIAFRAFSHFKK